MSARSLGLLGLALAACAAADDREPVRELPEPVAAPLAQAYCTAKVQGIGPLAVEDNYLPHVIACENGEAGPEALKAQAIAARSVVYYAMATTGSICNSQGCQVYSCGKKPQKAHYDAVDATRGMYLASGGMLTYAFFVDGSSSPDPKTCQATKGPNQKYVTYNEGATGTSVKQTKLGYVGAPGFGQNRGCMSQWGARCLENDKAYGYAAILKFFYGDDIQILTAPGQCTASSKEPPPPAGGELEPMTRDQIVHLAASGVGYSYWPGHARWDPVTGAAKGKCQKGTHQAFPPGGPEYGADAPGYVAQVWQAPSPNPPDYDRHPYKTQQFRFDQKNWFAIPRKDLKKGDGLVLHDGKSGHVLIFDRWTAGGKALVYECASCDVGCVYRPKSISKDYVAIRRRKLDEVDPNQPPEGNLEKADCNTLSGWARDADSPGDAVDVVASFDGPVGQRGVSSVRVSAADARDDLCQLLGSCNHGFSLSLPAGLKDGRKHSVYVYALDADRGPPRLLLGAPRSFKCGQSGPVGCTHTACAAGSALAPTCGSCEASVCVEQPACCTGAWDASCVEKAALLCGCIQGKCLHDPCSTGEPLSKSCSPCTAEVCVLRPECCKPLSGAWDASCVELTLKTAGACAGACAGGPSSCAHSECSAGAALAANCSACANAVCARDAFCCSQKWDWICAKEAKEDPQCSCPK